MHPRKVAVLVVTDVAALADGIRAELGDDYEISALSSVTDAVVRCAGATPPDVTVCGEVTGGAVGAARDIADTGVPTIVVEANPESREVLAAVAAGEVVQAVPPQRRPRELAAAVERAVALTDLRAEVGRLRSAMHRRIDALQILHDVSSAATDVDSYEQVVRVLMLAMNRIVPFDIGGALLAMEGGGSAVLHMHSQMPSSEFVLGTVRDRCLETFAALDGDVVDERTLSVNLSGERIDTSGESRALESSTHIALSVDRRPVGVIYLAAHRPNAFSSEDEKLLYFLANRTSDVVRRLSSRIHDERRRLSLMVESMADGLIMTDAHSEVALINPAARTLLGIDAPDGEVTRQYLKDTLGFYPFDLVATRSVASGGDDSKAVLREELKINERVLHSIVSPVRDSAGKLVGVVVVLRDITEATELAKRKEEFVSVVSHELRTPLTSVTGALDIVLKEYVGQVSEKQRRYLRMARDSCARLNVIVDDLLDVARSERGKMPMRFSPLMLDALAREAVERYRGAAESKGVNLRVVAEDSDIRIIGDADRLVQVLNNLLSNAIKFTPEDGTIDVEIFGPSVASTHVGVSVYNNGEPIPYDARERVFDKFEQIQESNTRRVGGTGLGLAISRGIIESHGGRIWVDPRDDGTKFVFTLPAAPEEEEVDAAAERTPAELREFGQGEQASTILLVGDDSYANYILKGLLMTAGHDVHSALSADQGLALARQQRPALVVIDTAAIDDDPLAMIEILTHDPDTKKAAILAIADSDMRGPALAAGAHDTVHKPIDAGAFRDACHRLLSESGSARAARILVVDDEQSIRMICREVLSAAGYHVREAGNGEEALVEAGRFRPDIMVLDVMMPEVDGFQTAQRFRAEPQTSMTPIIFLSARGETHDKVRAFRLGAEDYVVKPFDAAELVARVEKALERRDRELGASPTTQLPGANAIESEIERRLVSPEAAEQAYCYLDLDNLKAFNDYYGYAKADGVIRQTGDVIRDVIARDGNPGDFIGHIAGDDFVLITTLERVDLVCESIISTFDRLVPLYYNKVDRERGFIEAKDRFGIERKFPLMGVSIAAVTRDSLPAGGFSDLAAAAADGKKLAKSVVGSCYCRDGRIILGTPRNADSKEDGADTHATESANANANAEAGG